MRKSLLAAASASLVLMSGINASAGMFRPYPDMQQGAKTGFNVKQRQAGSFLPKSVDANGIMTPDHVLDATHKGEMETVGPLLSPKGEHWFYTLETTGNKIVDNGYTVTWNYDTFQLTVYDGKMNIVGYAHGKANFPEGAKRCQSIVPSLQLTGNFFNSNGNDYEVMMTFNFNPDDSKYLYGAKQSTQVYTLQSVMPQEPQKPLFEVPGYNSGALRSSTMSEGWVMSFSYETTWDNEKDDHNTTTLRVYKPAGWGTPPELIAQQKSWIDTGEGTNDPNPFFIALNGTEVYSVRTYYEFPLFEDSTADIPVVRPNNNFIIELYKPTSKNPINSDFTNPDAEKPVPYKTVSIPCSGPEGEQFYWRTYALGNFSGHTDVTWDFSEGGSDPCFIMTILDSNTQEDEAYYYEVYNIKGEKIKEFGERSMGYQRFSSVEGYPEQWGFDVLDDEGATVTKIMNWPSLEVVGQIPSLFEYEGNIYKLSSVPDRVPGDGGMLYAANADLAMGDATDLFVCIAYFKPDGSLHHVDELRLPENTAKAYAFVQAEVLDPYLYNTDSNYEYLIWHYTWKGGGAIGTDLSLAVVDHTGRILAKRQLPQAHSNENAFVSNCPDQRYIVMAYRDASSWSNNDQLEFISLPLNKFDGEGTVENPYLIRTWGDFDQVRNNLTSHFALASNVDLQNRAIRPIEGTFLGSIDGRGNAVKNLVLSAENKGALFQQIGERPETSTSEPTAALKNIIFNGISFNHAGSALGTKQYGVIAHTVRFAEFNNVQVVDPKTEIAGVNVEFGTFAYMAEASSFIDCAVKNADYNIERGNGVGGFVFDARKLNVTGGFFSGKIAGRKDVGGIIGRTNVEPSSITDCHVNANLSASLQNVGGIVGYNYARSLVKNNLVEGSITGTSNVGGVVGELAPIDVFEAFDWIVEGNVVALDEFNVGEKPEAAHRIVGYTSIDDGEMTRWVDNPNWDPTDPNSPSGEYVTMPAVAETKIRNNHVVSDIAPVDPAEGLATEGTTTSIEDADKEFFAGLGFKFGSDSKAPWVTSYWSVLPKLYYEDMIGATIQFTEAVYTGDMNTTLTMIAIGDGFDILDAAGSGLLSIVSSNTSVVDWAWDMVPVEGYSDRVGFPMTLKAEGEAEVTVSYKGMTATAKVVVRDPAGVESAVAATSVLGYANGVITAEGCAIEVYDVQGRKVATGFGELPTADFAAGLYIVRAASADNASTMKIMVK